MKSNIFNILALSISLLLTQTACAEDAKSPIQPLPKNTGNAAAGADEHVELNSLKFTSNNGFGDCNIYMSMLEKDNGSHSLVMKVDYRVHGVPVLDSEVSFYDYSSNDDQYYSLGEAPAGHFVNPALASIQLRDSAIDADLNLRDSYELPDANGVKPLVQWVIAQLPEGLDVHQFEETVEETVENPALLAQNTAILDQMQDIEMKVYHSVAGHYDPGLCRKLKLSSALEVKEYELNAEAPQGDDGDDDHGDEDDHDHDDEDGHDDHDGHDHDDEDDHDGHNH